MKKAAPTKGDILGHRPNIVCIGILDTKGEEIRFLAEEVTKAGGKATIMDVGLGVESTWADIPLGEVLSSTGSKVEEVFALDRTSAIEVVGNAGAKKIVELYEKGLVDGIIAWSGGVGTTVATIVMRALPIGVPKIMLSTLASGDVSNWVGNKDIYMVNPISEKGINRVTMRIVANAAAAIVAMGRVPAEPQGTAKPLVALTAYGTTTPAVVRCQHHMEAKGWDTIVVHQVGTGATMEDLIRSGHITAVFDITTAELSNTLLGSIYGMPKGWKGERLTAAGAMGIPQIVCPGGLAQVGYGPPDKVPESIMKGYRTGERLSYQNSKEPFPHNAAVCIITPTLEEEAQLGREIVTKLNRTKGPTLFVIPLRGWSAYDQPARFATIERGWSHERGDGPLWLPDPANPDWSHRATVMCDVVRNEVDRTNPNLDFFAVDMHILDEEFSALLNRCMDSMLDGTWKKGDLRETRGIVEL
ncbi:MAG TPA: Tm-1-like ATP-binding domain-containing protein [Spirochaetia bacterium]|nr:Tm-1-like ATP-binding domain-containing protein [Spirochaetia bacterium]